MVKKGLFVRSFEVVSDCICKTQTSSAEKNQKSYIVNKLKVIRRRLWNRVKSFRNLFFKFNNSFFRKPDGCLVLVVSRAVELHSFLSSLIFLKSDQIFVMCLCLTGIDIFGSFVESSACVMIFGMLHTQPAKLIFATVTRHMHTA